MSGETREKPAQRIHIEQHTFFGMAWFAAWLFTIGFAHLVWWKIILGVVVWPFYLGGYIG